MKNIQLIIDNKNIQWMPFNFFTEEDIVELARLFINRKYPDRKLVSNIKNGKMQKVTDSLFSMAKNWADNIDNPYSEIIKSYTSPLNDELCPENARDAVEFISKTKQHFESIYNKFINVIQAHNMTMPIKHIRILNKSNRTNHLTEQNRKLKLLEDCENIPTLEFYLFEELRCFSYFLLITVKLIILDSKNTQEAVNFIKDFINNIIAQRQSSEVYFAPINTCIIKYAHNIPTSLSLKYCSHYLQMCNLKDLWFKIDSILINEDVPKLITSVKCDPTDIKYYTEGDDIENFEKKYAILIMCSAKFMVKNLNASLTIKLYLENYT